MNNPLFDEKFLLKLNEHRNKIIYAKITSLTSENYPNEQIEGIATAGSITLDGTSAVRRVCSLTLITEDLNINNIYWGLTTRIKIEIGIQNNLIEYSNYPNIIWFPQGIFILTDFKTSAKVNNYSIKLTGKDKMCLLNGDIGGNFNAETQLDIERIQQEDGSFLDEKRPISYIIREMVHHYAQESFHNIIIKDIDILSRKMLTNNTGIDIYLIQNIKTNCIVDIANPTIIMSSKDYYYYNTPDLLVNFSHLKSDFKFKIGVGENDDNGLIETNETPTYLTDINKKNIYAVIQISPGEDIGYELTETYYPEELIAGIGDTVTSILDKIIKTFGNYEYYYNIEGQFIFKEKDTYINNAWNNTIKIEDEQFIAPAALSKLVKYSFESGQLTTAYSNNPQLGKIKNDFTVWGKKKLASGEEIPIHVRYAIDKKPYFYKSYDDINYMSSDFFNNIVKNNFKYSIIENEFEESRDGIEDIDIQIYPDIKIGKDIYKITDWREVIYQMSKDYYKHNYEDDFHIIIQRNNNKNFIKKDNSIINYRPYEQGKTGYEHYYHDINGFWRSLYLPKDEAENIKITDKNNIQIIDLNNFYKINYDDTTKIISKEYIGPWNKNILDNPASLLFWFDFYDSEALGIGQFSVPAIGDRPKNINKDEVRAIIYKHVPNIIYIEKKQYEIYKQARRLLSGFNYLIYDATKQEENSLEIIKDILENNETYIKNGWTFYHYLENNQITISTRSITAQETIDDLLYKNAYSNETITIQSIPIYYLEPNTIISAMDKKRGVSGYYIMNKISLPLDYKGIMKITAIKVPERITY